MSDLIARTFAKRPVGKTGLMVTPIGMGTAPLGSMPWVYTFDVPDDRGIQTVRRFFQGPLNFIDTAAMYGDGTAERRIGAVIRELGGLPEGFVLETKADRDMQTGDWSAEQMRRSVERSLSLLGVDHLQLCLIHDTETSTWEQVTADDGPLAELVKMKAEGIIGHLGIGAGPINMIMRYVETGLMEVVMTHNRFNLIDREAEPLMDLCQRRAWPSSTPRPTEVGSWRKGLMSSRASATARPRRSSSSACARCRPPAHATACRSRPPRCSSRCAIRVLRPPSSA